jgi:DNA-binding response OmpR family regulator
VLLAEDEPADKNLVKRSLEGFGCELRIVATGEALLEYFEQREGGPQPSPDLILLDLGLPAKRGNEVLVQLRAMTSSWVPIVIFSGSDDLPDIV